MNKVNNQRNNQFNINLQKEDINVIRQDMKLSLRKNKLDTLFMKKRNFKNKDNEIYIDYEYICKYLPEILINEYDNYDDKLEVICNFLKGDFSLLSLLEVRQGSFSISFGYFNFLLCLNESLSLSKRAIEEKF